MPPVKEIHRYHDSECLLESENYSSYEQKTYNTMRVKNKETEIYPEGIPNLTWQY